MLFCPDEKDQKFYMFGFWTETLWIFFVPTQDFLLRLEKLQSDYIASNPSKLSTFAREPWVAMKQKQHQLFEDGNENLTFIKYRTEIV